jgi:hypothetical protein
MSLAKFRRGSASGVEKVWSASIRSSRRTFWGSLEGEGMTGGGVPTAAEAAAEGSSSARGFRRGSGAMLRSRSCNKRRGAEGGVRRRQELTGDEGNDGDRAPVTDWHQGRVVELRRGAVKLPRWSSGTMGGSRWELRGDQGLTGEEEGGSSGVRGSGRVENKRESGMGREGAGEALKPEKRGRGGMHGQLLRRRGGGRQSRGAAWHARERAREEELGRCLGWGRRVEAKAAGGGAGEDLARG